jgi:hypothetical protein
MAIGPGAAPRMDLRGGAAEQLHGGVFRADHGRFSTCQSRPFVSSLGAVRRWFSKNRGAAASQGRYFAARPSIVTLRRFWLAFQGASCHSLLRRGVSQPPVGRTCSPSSAFKWPWARSASRDAEPLETTPCAAWFASRGSRC